LPRKPFPSTGSTEAGASEKFAAGARVPVGAGSAGFSSVAPVDAEGISVGPGATSLADIGEALRSVAAIRAFAVGEADAVAENVFAGETFIVVDAFAEDVFAENVFAEAAFALDVEAGAAESEAEAGADAGAGRPLPSLIRAKADDPNGNPKTANSMAATATLTSLSLGVGANARALSN
jgi:hypothetical protein